MCVFLICDGAAWKSLQTGFSEAQVVVVVVVVVQRASLHSFRIQTGTSRDRKAAVGRGVCVKRQAVPHQVQSSKQSERNLRFSGVCAVF